MKPAYRPIAFVLLIVAGLAVVIAVSASRPRPKDRIPWRTDFDAARAEADRAGKPVFAYFGASWCGPCQGLKSTTWADPRVEQALQAYVPVHVDVDEHPDLARRYVPTPSDPDGGIPAFRVLDRDGNVVKEMTGAAPVNEFLGWLGGK